MSTLRRAFCYLLPLLLGVVAGSPAATSSSFAYRSYAEMARYLRELNATYPDVVRVSVAQETYSLPYPDALQCIEDDDAGTEAPCQHFVVHLTNHSTLPEEPTRPEVFISGALHGNERVGPQAAIELVALLARSASVYADDAGELEPSISTRRWARELVNARNVVITPMTNAHGYSHNHREELHVDPNRDYNYMRAGEECMQSMTSRVVNEIWRDHVFQLAITFHAGTRAVSYEWGSPDHYLDGDSKRSEKSPDHTAQFQLAHTLANFAGVFPDDQLYPTGTMNDIVYGVTGGMEDWGYAASWENQFYSSPGDTPPFQPCEPSTFGGYPTDKTVYNNVTHRAFNMLVETSNKKQPAESDLGRYSELYGADVDFFHTMESEGGGDVVGHVPRNVRLALMMIEMVQPLLRWVDAGFPPADVALVEERTSVDTFPDSSKYTMDPNSDLVAQMGCGALAWENEEVATCNATDCSLAELEEKSKLQIAWEVLGALTVDSTHVQVASSVTFEDASILLETSTQQGTTRRYYEFTPESSEAEEANADTKGTSLFVTCVDLANVTSAETKQLYVRALATVDQDWADQGDGDDLPSPRVLPQSHVVNARTNPNWNAEWNGHRVKAATEWTSPVITVQVSKSESGSARSEKDATAPSVSAAPSLTPVAVPSPASSLESSQSGSASPTSGVGSDSESGTSEKDPEKIVAPPASEAGEEIEDGSSESSSGQEAGESTSVVASNESDDASNAGSDSALTKVTDDSADTHGTATLTSSDSDSGATSDDDEPVSEDTKPKTQTPMLTPSPTKKVGLTTVGPISSTIHDDESDNGAEDSADSETTLDDEIKANDEHTSASDSAEGPNSNSEAAEDAALALNDSGLQNNETPSELLNVGYLIMGSGALIIALTLAYLYRRVFRGGRAAYMNINSDEHVARVTINGDDEEYEVDDEDEDEDENDVVPRGAPLAPRGSHTSQTVL